MKAQRRSRAQPAAAPEALPPHYDFAGNDPALYEAWERAGVFAADASRSRRVGGDRDPFVIVMPPPNVTAVLHMGHGLDNAAQDVIIRWRRMAGDEALWLPGTDHAGIATQNVVERQLAAEGKSRFDIGRDAFVARTTKFVEETGARILQQLRTIGASADWTRTAYTLSPDLSRAVREAFVRLYERGLIYRGHRVIHWCPRCLTSLSDEEAEHREEDGELYHVAYALEQPRGSVVALTVATTRPETILGDVAIAVHPDDERYRELIGKKVRLPLTAVYVPVIADTAVDPSFGTGAVKVTPAHDPNDFEIGVRHSLPMPVVMTPEARMQEISDADGRVPSELAGLDRFDARRRIVDMLRASGALKKVVSHRLAIRHCYRCDTVVEPRLSDQWFVRMQPLAEPALAAVRDGAVRILPERYEGIYINWLENIRDWNVSRQLWWGHRIPIWYCERCPDPIVAREAPALCPTCGGPVTQDPDVLDTWFSSWLWPFSTLGWPNETTEDMRAFYPTDVLVSGPEILFFWIARMIMAGYAFLGRSPYHTVYLHGVVRDTQHRRMSKSLGNGIDPLDVVNLYGADALRWTVTAGLGVGTDIILDPEALEQSFAPGRNFVTKLWNIGRYLLANVGDEPVIALADIPDASLARDDRWILSRLDVAIAECDAALGPARPNRFWSEGERRAGMRLNEYAETARRFVWNELADWYLESVKHRVASSGEGRTVARAVLVHVVDAALRLLHPIVPFITETLWQRLPASARLDTKFLARAVWPRTTGRGDATDFERVRDALTAIRQIRADNKIPPGAVLVGTIVTQRPEPYLEALPLISRLGKLTVTVAATLERTEGVHAVLPLGDEVVVAVSGVIDVERECAKLRQELAELEKHLAALEQRLSSDTFTSRAPKQVVEAERQKRQDWIAKRAQLQRKVASLCGKS